MSEKPKPTKIRVEIDVPGMGREVHEYEHCPIHFYKGRCPFVGECNYGLTALHPPPHCPIGERSPVEMKFYRIKGTPNDTP